MSTSLVVPLCEEVAGADLDLATTLVASQTAMLATTALPDLWPTAADEAFKLIESDGVAVVSHRRHTWSTLVTRTSSESDTLATTAVIERLVGRGKLTRIAHGDALTTLELRAGQSEQACLVAAFRAPLQGADLSILWFAGRSTSLRAAMPVAELFARQVEQAAHSINRSDTLTEAIAARHHIGMAQGVLMSRYGLTADQAFAILRRHSQRSNVKIRIIAEQVLQTCSVPDARIRD